MTMESRPMIENSDRGITLSKPLAWSVLMAVVGAVWFGATTITGMSSATQGVIGALTEIQATNDLMDSRIRAVEIAQASQSSDLRAIQNGVSRIEMQINKLAEKP